MDLYPSTVSEIIYLYAINVYLFYYEIMGVFLFIPLFQYKRDKRGRDTDKLLQRQNININPSII